MKSLNYTSVKKVYTFPYNHNNENDRRIRTKNILDMRIEWNPEKIIFNDGSLAD